MLPRVHRSMVKFTICSVMFFLNFLSFFSRSNTSFFDIDVRPQIYRQSSGCFSRYFFKASMIWFSLIIFYLSYNLGALPFPQLLTGTALTSFRRTANIPPQFRHLYVARITDLHRCEDMLLPNIVFHRILIGLLQTTFPPHSGQSIFFTLSRNKTLLHRHLESSEPTRACGSALVGLA